MNTSVSDGNFCWLCTTPGSCTCEISNSSWPSPASQASFRTSDGVNGGVDEPCVDDGNYAFANTPKGPDFEVYDSGHGSNCTFAASTPKNNRDVEKWESPDAMPPPESSSPVGFDADISPLFTDAALSTRTPYREDSAAVDRRLLCYSLDGGQWRSSVSYKHGVDSNSPIFPTTTSTNRYYPSPTDYSTPAPGSLYERLLAMSGQEAAPDSHDVCVVSGRTVPERSDEIPKPDENHYVPRSRSLTSRRRALLSGPTILDFAVSAELEHTASLSGFGNDSPCDAGDETRREDGFSSQTPMDDRLKRRRSPVDCFLKSKRAKLERTVSLVSCTSVSSIQSKYQATRPASLRRAESLTSEISACSGESTDSLFDPSPILSSRPRVANVNEYPPTAPNTPLPDSVDYARSKANPLVRTLAVYRHRSLDICTIPPGPIIAPPSNLQPGVVSDAEDHAINRLEALLQRERSERERDGLNVHDEERTERLKALYGSDPPISRRDSASSSESDDECDQWEEETTLSMTASQESQETASSVKIQILSEQYRLASRKTWVNAYGIANDFRKEITRWILEEVPEEPVPVSGKPLERPHGADLHDQLMNSFQTRFHAAQLFHRYFVLPEKVVYWREARKYESRGYGDLEYESGVWDLAVACMGLSVKLHRDCLMPLRPVFAAEFLRMAPHSMTHETFELAQRDVLYTFRFQLGTCTPQDVLDELWNALPTLRKATAPIGWTAVQAVIWDKLFESFFEPDTLRFPVTLLTAAALVDSLAFALASQYKSEAEASICQCKVSAQDPAEGALNDVESTSWQIHLHEASELVNDVILDVKDVLHITHMELDECRKWLNHVGHA